jgi:hypothetical protein
MFVNILTLIGLSLSQHALVVRNTPKHEKNMHLHGQPVDCRTEEDIFTALGLDYVAPHQRYVCVCVM